MKITHTDILWSKTLPEYTQFQEMVIEGINVPNQPLHCLEFGIGNADTSLCLLQAYPEARLSIVDEDARALETAYANFPIDLQNRTHTIQSLFQDYQTTETFNVCISALSMHYLKRSEQLQLFEKIYNLLTDDGVFVLGDLIKSEDFDYQMSTNMLYDSHRESTLSEKEKDAFFSHVTTDSYYFYQLTDVMNWLRDVGFKAVDLTWSHRSLAVIRAVK